ncbi:MAG: hypothetical protein QNJ20_20120 [Paracoccaceae bacterium]|nr:hypothetical protein [Paracoccaceae bacterium]
MARKPKTPKNKAETASNDGSEATEALDPTDIEDPVSSESTEEPPVVIEAEATEVDATPKEDTATSDPAEEADGFDATSGTSEPDTAKENPEVVEEMPTPPQAATPEPARSGYSFFPLMLGGLVAGGLGYLAATQFPITTTPESEPMDTSAFSDGIAQNSAQLAALTSQVEELASAEGTPATDLAPVEQSLTELSERIGTVTTDLATLRQELSKSVETLTTKGDTIEERLSVLESAEPPAQDISTDEELAAFRAEVDQMTTDAEARLAEARRLSAEAEEAAAAARAEAEAKVAEAEAAAALQSKMIDLRTAVESGARYSGLLEGLDNIPDAIAKYAETGIATIGDLQRAYPAAARAALSVSETIPEDASTGERFTAFLKRQTNARSLRPKEGDGADAVLSRAEARLGNGELAEALAELDKLPEEGKAALGDWLSQAMARIAALEAIRDLTTTN